MHACMHAYIHTHLTLHCTSLQYITLHYITVHYATLHHIHTCIHRCTHRKSQGRLGRGLPWVAPLAAGTCCASKRVFLVVLFRVFSRARVGTVPVTGCAIWIAYSCKDFETIGMKGNSVQGAWLGPQKLVFVRVSSLLRVAALQHKTGDGRCSLCPSPSGFRVLLIGLAPCLLIGSVRAI